MKRILAFVCFFSSLAFGQGSLVPAQQALKTVNGITAPIPNATITVCSAGVSGIPCSPASINIFKDAALTQPLSNPMTADSLGNYVFAVTPGNYTVTVTAAGFAGYSYQLTASLSPSANNTFTGTNQYSGSTTFNGPVTANGTTNTGTTNIGGNLTAIAGQNQVNAYLVNGIRFVDGVHYLCSGAGIQLALADAITAGGGDVDARGCQTASFTSETDVGNASNIPVTLWVPAKGLWTSHITLGSSAYALRVFSKAAVIGSTGGGEGKGFRWAIDSTSSVGAVCGNDTVGGDGAYARFEGFECFAPASSTVSAAVLNINGLSDEGSIALMGGTTNMSAPGVWIHGSANSALIRGINGETNAIGTGTPCVFGGPASGDANRNIIVLGASCVHPAAGVNAVLIQQNFTGGNSNNLYSGIYMEATQGFSDTTTPYVSITNTGGTVLARDTLDHFVCNVDVTSSTKYCVSEGANTAVQLVSLTTSNISKNAIQDNSSQLGITQNIVVPVSSTIPSYPILGTVTSPASLIDNPNVSALFGQSGQSATNRGLNFAHIGNASTVKNYIFFDGTLGSSSTTGTPVTTTTSSQPAFGIEGTDSAISFIFAPSGANQTISRPFGCNQSTANCVFGANVNFNGVNASSLTSLSMNTGNIIVSAFAPTISSGFGTSPCIGADSTGTTCSGTVDSIASFVVNVGTGGTATSGVIAFHDTNSNGGYNCICQNMTTTTLHVRQTAKSTNSCTIGSFNSAETSTAWTASDELLCSAFGR